MENFLTALLFALCLHLFLCGTPSARGQDTDALPELREIVWMHARAIARVEVTQRLNSYLARGRTIQGEQEARFTLYSKEGNLRYELVNDDEETVVLYRDGKAWQWMEAPERANLRQLSTQQAAWLAREARFEGLLSNYRELDYLAKLIGIVQLEGLGPVIQIRLYRENSPVQIMVYLDATTYLERRRDFQPDADATVLETYFDDFRSINGVTIPFKIENRLNSETVSTTLIETMEINPGILSFTFSVPQDFPDDEY